MILVTETKRIVAEITGISVAELESSKRKRDAVEARFICYKIIRTHSNVSLKYIANHFGNRDHSTVIHGLQTHDDLMSVISGSDYKLTYNKCLEAVERSMLMMEYEPIINAS